MSRGGTPAPKPGPTQRDLCLLTALGLAVRLWNALVAGAGQAWLLDERSYFAAGAMIAAHGPALPAGGVSGPLFPALLAPGLRVFGAEPDVARATVAVLGTAVVPLTALIGGAIGGRRVGLAAGLLVAGWPPIVFWQGLVMTEGLAALFVTAVCWLAIGGWPRPAVRAGLAGALIGIASLVRPNLLLLLPLIAGWQVIDRVSWRQRLLRAGLVIACYGAVMAPWWHRQYELNGTLVLATIKAGDVLIGANNPSTYSGPDAFGWIDPVDLPGWWGPGYGELTEVERDRLRTRAAIAFARDNADRLPAVAAWRWIDYWQIHLGQKRDDLPPNPQESPILQGLHLLAIALAATTALTWSRRDRRVALLSIVVFVGSLVGIVFWGGGGRFRSPFDPLLLILAVVGLKTLIPGRKPSRLA